MLGLISICGYRKATFFQGINALIDWLTIDFFNKNLVSLLHTQSNMTRFILPAKKLAAEFSDRFARQQSWRRWRKSAAVWRLCQKCQQPSEVHRAVDGAQGSHYSPQACVVLPWLPYKGLFPEMLPFSHSTNLLLMPIHILSHQDLKGKETHERGNTIYIRCVVHT